MRLLARLFVGFCVATVVAQIMILSLSFFRGNFHKDTFAKAIALINGIDISGDQLQQMLKQAQETPVPTYEDIVNARAREDRDLQMREESIRQMKTQTDEMMMKLKEEVADFDRRKDDFYKWLEQEEKNLLDASLKEVQRTIEALSAEQAKDQLLRLLKAEQTDQVVAIVKEMPLDKRKKILGEFTEAEEANQLHEILMQILAGEPTKSLIEGARQNQPPGQSPPAN